VDRDEDRRLAALLDAPARWACERDDLHGRLNDAELAARLADEQPVDVAYAGARDHALHAERMESPARCHVTERRLDPAAFGGLTSN
jgi:hypothetical protein